MQCTMLELLNQLDGFSSSEDIKVGRGRWRGSRRGVGFWEGTAGYWSLLFVQTVMGNRCGAALTPNCSRPDLLADACHPP